MDLYRLIYKLGPSEVNLRILGKKFLENNGNKGCLIINNKKISPSEFIHIKKKKIILMLNKYVYNKSCMFKDCNLLESFSKISNDDYIENINNAEKIINNEYLSKKTENQIKNNNSFNYWGAGSEDENLSMISEISSRDEEYLDKSSILFFENKLKFSLNNYVILNEMFSNCESLLSLTGISKMRTNNVTDMSYMFSNCKSLISLPDISNWNTSNAIYKHVAHIINFS